MTRILIIIVFLFATPACTPINSEGINTGVALRVVGGLILAGLVYNETEKDSGGVSSSGRNRQEPICRSPCGPSDEVCIAVCAE